jgi:hypothetical protein
MGNLYESGGCESLGNVNEIVSAGWTGSGFPSSWGIRVYPSSFFQNRMLVVF